MSTFREQLRALHARAVTPAKRPVARSAATGFVSDIRAESRREAVLDLGSAFSIPDIEAYAAQLESKGMRMSRAAAGKGPAG